MPKREVRILKGMNTPRLTVLNLVTAAFITAVPLVNAGCQCDCGGTDEEAVVAPVAAEMTAIDTSFIPASFDPPQNVDMDGYVLRMLEPSLAQVDYDAFMSSRVRLRNESGGSWPSDDETVAGNAADLARHEREFFAREAFAYAALTPDLATELGCVYINPVRDGDTTGNDARVSMWATDAARASGFEAKFEADMQRWITNDWPFSSPRF